MTWLKNSNHSYLNLQEKNHENIECFFGSTVPVLRDWTYSFKDKNRSLLFSTVERTILLFSSFHCTNYCLKLEEKFPLLYQNFMEGRFVSTSHRKHQVQFQSTKTLNSHTIRLLNVKEMSSELLHRITSQMELD